MRVPGPMLEALRAGSKTLQAIGTHDPTAAVLNTADGAVDIRGETVSANFFDVFGVSPVLGRGFVPDEERPGSPAVMLVSLAFWRRHLGAEPTAVGRVLHLDAVPYTVLGIMPPEFRTTFLESGPDFWTPYAGNRSRARERELGYKIVARFSRGVTIEQARSEVDALTDDHSLRAIAMRLPWSRSSTARSPRSSRRRGRDWTIGAAREHPDGSRLSGRRGCC